MNYGETVGGVLTGERTRCFMHRVAEIALRLPGLLLLEIWWRNRDIHITKDILQHSPFSSYLEMDKIIEFVQTRNFDQSAAYILSYAVLLSSSVFLLLPLSKLLQVYSHAISVVLFGIAHYLSIRYVHLEQNGDPELQLDDFTKLERHGFHILAQLMLCVVQSCLLDLQSDVARIMLAVFLIPVIARMCGFPVARLILAHNVACSLAMLFICIYVLNKVPTLILSVRRSYRVLRAVLIVRGIGDGAVTVWRRLKFAELLTLAWLTMFFVRIYVDVVDKERGWEHAGAIFLSAIAESTSTPLSLLALALTVSHVCKLVVHIAQWAVGDRREHGHVLAHGGYTEALTLVFLCAQTGLLGMRTEQKAFLLGLVLFIVMSALLQSLFELLEPQLLALAATRTAPRSRHSRSLMLAAFLTVAPICMASAISRFLPIDLWCVIIVSNCLLTTLHTVSTTVVYGLIVVETRSVEPWELCDDLIFICKTSTRLLEIALALIVVVYGIYASLTGQWTLASIAVLGFHTYFNVWCRVKVGLASVRARRAALQNLSQLMRAPKHMLEEKGDVCAICFLDMREEARITPCNHLFHGACLRKWLNVKQVCPLCYANVCSKVEAPKERRFSLETENDSEDDIRRRLAAPYAAAMEEYYSSEWDTESTSSDLTEYTLASSDGAESAR